MEDIRIGIIGHGFMGHEHEKNVDKRWKESVLWAFQILILSSLRMFRKG